MAIQGRQHSKLPPDAQVYVRDTGAPIRAEDEEQFSPEFVAKGLINLREQLQSIARRSENHSNPVDEYNTCPLGGTSTITLLTLQPTYEYMPEKILAILVGGPPAAVVTLTLGDRVLPLILPAAGILPVGPVAMILGRADPRYLTAVTPGQYFLELMGYADQRFNA